MADKTIAQRQDEWAAHGNIAKMQARLATETDARKRAALEEAIAVQRKRISPG
ncbi:MAG TPA: hypothetical protein VJL82_04425 [Rhizomicrobium sp.]|nr:hypothetical protein [Rhizomicrobium sp.]